MRRLLTGTGICERTLWESLAVRDQLRRDVPTTPRGWPRSAWLAQLLSETPVALAGSIGALPPCPGC